MHYPRHLALIPDGNRTRAKSQGLTLADGYLKSIDVGQELIEYIFTKTQIEVFTGRGLSTENVKERSKEELDLLFWLYKIAGDRLDTFLRENQVSFRWVWSPVGLSQDFVDYLVQKQRDFSFNTGKAVVFAINYGGRDEILRGIAKLIADGGTQNFASSQEETFSRCLDFGDLPVVDLVIRTKWDMAKRTSGFMSRWIGYAELYFTETLYPAFTVQELQRALEWFDGIVVHRNYGK